MGRKKAFKMKYKTFFMIFKALSLKQTKHNFLEHESPNLENIDNVEEWFRGAESRQGLTE